MPYDIFTGQDTAETTPKSNTPAGGSFDIFTGQVKTNTPTATTAPVLDMTTAPTPVDRSNFFTKSADIIKGFMNNKEGKTILPVNPVKNIINKPKTPALKATIGENMSPEQTEQAENIFSKSSQDPLLEQLMTIKAPFIDAGITIPKNTLLGGGIIKAGIEVPERGIRTISEGLLSLTKYKGLTEEDRAQTHKFTVPSYNEVAGKTTEEMIDAGLSPIASVILGSAAGAGEFANDALIYESLITSAARKVTSGIGKITNNELKTAHEFLGNPKTLEEARVNMLKIQKEFHPDKIGGNTKISAQANDAYRILVKEGIPSGNAVGKVSKMPEKKTEIKGIPEKTGQYIDAETQLHPTLIKETQEHIAQYGDNATVLALTEKLGATPNQANAIIQMAKTTQSQTNLTNIKEVAQKTMQEINPKPESIIKRTEPNTLTHATSYESIYDILNSGKIEARIPKGEEMTTKDKSISFSRSKNIETFKNEPIKIILDKESIPKTKPFGNKIEQEERLYNSDVPISSIKRIEIYKNPLKESASLTEQKINDIITLAKEKGVEVVRYDKPEFIEQATKPEYKLKPVEKTKETKITLKGEEHVLPKQLISKTQVKSLLTNLKVDELNLKVIDKDGKKMLHYEDSTRKMNITPSALGLVDKNLEVGKTMTITKNDLKKEGTAFRAIDRSGGELGSLASTSPQGNKTIRKMIDKQKVVESGGAQEVPEGFKISERAKSILEKYGVPVAERSLSKRLLGVYKPLTQKVRVQALYDVTTVTHEGIHAIDDQINFSKELIESTGRGATVRKELTDIYEDIYPGAKRTHKLETRMKEGLAVLFENYFYDPASIKAKYPNLVESFIEPTGEYYDPKFTELLDDMNSLVDDYAKLTPEQRIGSRIRTGKEVVDQQTGFTTKQRLEYEIFNRFEPLKRYGQEAGVTGTWDDPYVQAFNIMNKNSIAASWINGDSTPILMRDGNFKIEKGSVQDYMKIIKGNNDAFRSYLVARRVVADNNRLTALKNYIHELDAFTGSMGGAQLVEGKEALDEISKLEKTLDRDDFSLQDASAVVEKYTDKFKEAVTIYDDINKRLITMSEENGLMSKDQANLYREGSGYTSFARFIDEELQSVGTIKSGSKSKVSSFKERTGSQLDIIDPIYSQINAINEIISKSLENRLWTKVADIANKNPQISRRFEKMKSEPSVDASGNISFPQEKDPNVIRIFRNGKREFYRAGPEFIAVAKQLRPKEFDTFAWLLRIPSSTFTRLTTSANPLFAAGNLTVDQFSALAQTKTGFKPIVDPAKSFYKYVTSDKGLQAYKAMGGQRQTLASFFDLSPDQIANKLAGGETKTEKALRIFDSSIGVLEVPANMSEIMTRYSEFARAKAMGKTDSEAMFMAAEITTPFQLQGNIGGRVGQDWVKSIPYFNSIIQVLYKFGRSAKGNPKRMASVMAGLLTVGLSSAVFMMKHASEKQKRLFAEQPVRNASRYLYFPSPDGEALIKIRIPEQMGVFTGMGYLYIQEHYGGNEATFDDYLKVAESTLPEQVQVWNPGKALFSWVPQAFKPGIQTAFNFKVFPEIGPIVPFYMQNRKPSEQYNAYTSRVAKAIGQWMNISPSKTEFLVRNQLGAIGGLTMGKVPGNPLYIQEKEFVMTGRSYNKFYDNRELVRQNYQEMKDKPDSYTYEQQYEIKKDYQLYNNISEILSDMGKINKIEALPENIKSKTYELLLGLDGDKDIEPVVYELKAIVEELKSQS
jgi:hypothetical protein